MLIKKKFRLGVVCGGPSLERGISLNSARSLSDHLNSDQIEIVPIYFDQNKNSFLVSRAQLYSNTPSDFDFKLSQTANRLNRSELKGLLNSLDIVFPAIHGTFGEDGELQSMLENWEIPFVGSSEEACKRCFHKFYANEFIRKHGFYAPPSILLEKGSARNVKIVNDFVARYNLKQLIVKPACGGSSIAVYLVKSAAEALAKAKVIFEDLVDSDVVIEPLCRGREFTVIILQNRFGHPVAIVPTEIEITSKDWQIFDYRMKYLASRQVKYHCPPRFTDEVIFKIQARAEQLFSLFGLADFARFDGWVTESGEIWFSDFNPISGMEQNSFLFMQAARLGMTHADLLHYILQSSCQRQEIEFPQEVSARNSTKKETVKVIFGGTTAERQVSLMSGTNAWLKLKRSTRYHPEPYLLADDKTVWKLPYGFALNHTVEEVKELCDHATEAKERLRPLVFSISERLGLLPTNCTAETELPRQLSLEQFIKEADTVFIGLHGGIGENGVLQSRLEKAGVAFTGSGSATSRLGMNKWNTALALNHLEKYGIFCPKKKLVPLSFFAGYKAKDFKRCWAELVEELGANILIKPNEDGCSAGVARLYKARDLERYLKLAIQGAPVIPANTLTHQRGFIEMPSAVLENVLIEEFIMTDSVRVKGKKLLWQDRGGWVEVTIGVLQRDGILRSMHPSLTVAAAEVLSLEEKFQGGTGINITPPPEPFVKYKVVKAAMKRLERVAEALGIEGYARIDAFMNIKSGELKIIEANTLPGLTPSTVIYHQALAENPPIYPTEFLERIIDNAIARSVAVRKVG